MAIQSKRRNLADQYAEELKDLIRRGFPDAEFEFHRRGAKEYDLDVYGEFEDGMPVEELISDRPTHILLESGIHIHVLPLGPRQDHNP